VLASLHAGEGVRGAVAGEHTVAKGLVPVLALDEVMRQLR
jgi:hypothetical protein